MAFPTRFVITWRRRPGVANQAIGNFGLDVTNELQLLLMGPQSKGLEGVPEGGAECEIYLSIFEKSRISLMMVRSALAEDSLLQ